MKPLFLLTNRNVAQTSLKLTQCLECGNLYTNKSFSKKFDDATILIEGYVLPANDTREKLPSKLSQHELVFELFQKHDRKFINYIKGFFCIVLISKDKIYVFNDQLGLNKFFYFQSGDNFYVSNSYKALYQEKKEKRINGLMLCQKALLNREVNGQTIIEGIYFSQSATCMSIEKSGVTFDNYWDYSTIKDLQNTNNSYLFFADLLKKNIENVHQIVKPQDVAITLTGGKDSRTALCALLASGIKPLGITYGNPGSKDAVYAGKMAKSAGINHVVVTPEKTSPLFEQAAIEIIHLDNPLINIHRSHRFSAFKHVQQLLGKDVAYYGGYLGGELLMGPYYDDLIFTRFVTDAWDTNRVEENIQKILEQKFVKPVDDHLALSDHLSSVQTLSSLNSKEEKQFHGLFEIGILHHSQDLFLAGKMLKYPIPFFLDLDFLCHILASAHSYEKKRDSRTINLLKRYGLYEFNLNLQHILYPALDRVPFAKKGSYNTQEFLNGPCYWAMVKSVRYILDRKKYPPTFSYNQAYREFIFKYLKMIREDKNSWVHDYYDVPLAIESLQKQPLFTQEKEWHIYSNIVMHYLQIKYYEDEL